MKKEKMTRKEFLQVSSAGIGGIAILNSCASEKKSKWRFFTMEEVEVVKAISEQIIPGDEDPGAREANVINFIDKMLVTYHERYQQTYRTGLQGTQQTSDKMFGAPFEKLTWNQQTDVLKALESGKAEGDVWKDTSSSQFFGLIRDHTMQGFYGSPRHGGNRGYASYDMLGLDYPNVQARRKNKV